MRVKSIAVIQFAKAATPLPQPGVSMRWKHNTTLAVADLVLNLESKNKNRKFVYLKNKPIKHFREYEQFSENENENNNEILSGCEQEIVPILSGAIYAVSKVSTIQATRNCQA
jgi:hypothetical protein